MARESKAARQARVLGDATEETNREEVTLEQAQAEDEETKTSGKHTIAGNAVDTSKYVKTKVTDEEGKLKGVKFDINDDIAVKLRDMSLDEVYSYVAEVTGTDYRSKYARLNLGMQRMNLGNKLRMWPKLEEKKAAKEAKAAEREAAKKAKAAEIEAAKLQTELESEAA
jgi:hypothetical protein